MSITINQLINKMNEGITLVINEEYLKESINLLNVIIEDEKKDNKGYYALLNIKPYEKKLSTLNSILDLYLKNKLKPVFYIVQDKQTGFNKIKVKQHNFGSLKEDNIGCILNYNAKKHFEKAEDIIDFILENAKHFTRKENQSLYFIRDNTLYFNVEGVDNILFEDINSSIEKEYMIRGIDMKSDPYGEALLPF